MLIVKEWQSNQSKSNKKREIIEKNHKELGCRAYLKGYSVKIIPFLFGNIGYFSYI